MFVLKSLAGPLLFLVFFVIYGVTAWHIPELPFEKYDSVNSSTIPKIYSALGLLFCSLNVISILIKLGYRGHVGNLDRKAITKVVQMVVAMIVFSMTIESLGFLISSTLFLISGFLIMGESKPRLLILSSLPVVVFFWFVVTQILGIYLAQGTFWS